MAQLITLTSEALQATVRRLLPSQRGFGEDLQATNVVTPIIDLTPTAEGTQLQTDLQQALSFGNALPFGAVNTTTNIQTGGGFFRLTGTANVKTSPGQPVFCAIQVDDGVTTKGLWQILLLPDGTLLQYSESFDFVVFLRAQDTVKVQSNFGGASIDGSARQIADSQGNLVNPVGFTFE